MPGQKCLWWQSRFILKFVSSSNKYASTSNECNIVEEHKTFKGFKDAKLLLDQKTLKCQRVQLFSLNIL